MSRRTILLVAVLAGCGSDGARPEMNAPAQEAVTAGRAAQGEKLYTTHCLTCHGTKGMGDGPAALYLFPKPRDFTRGLYKVRTTGTGELPTDQDLFDTITDGMPGSAMPSFSFLSVQERSDLVAHLKALAVIEDDEGKKHHLWTMRGAPKPIAVGTAPPATPDLVRKGREAYQKMQCFTCHGAGGKGDGLSAPTLRDDWGYPLPPNNFTRGIYKGGGADADIYLRFTTGMNGTPMPSFEKQLSDEERWALVAYVKSLAGEKVAKQGRETALAAGRVPKLPVNPFDAAWDKVDPASLPFMLTWQRQEEGDTLWVRAVHDGASIAVMIEWDDPTMNARLLRTEDFTDACAVQFALGADRGHFTMGEKDKPVNLWHWKMDRQVDLAKYSDLEDLYPGMMSDDYPLAGRDTGKAKEGWPPRHEVLPAQSHDPTYLSGWGAGNPLSNPHKVTAVQDLNAAGFGTLEIQPPEDQDVTGRGVWNSGRWRVVFVRAMSTKGAKDVKLAAGSTADVAFAVWDGAARDRDGQKCVTAWHKMAIK
jgi:mono/diheme cytochrome c family protein